MKKTLATIGLVSTMMFGATVDLPIGDNMVYVKSYETYLYDTPDGQLGNNEYALTDSGNYIIQDKPKNEANVTVYENYDVSGMTLVNKVGKATYSEFYSKKENRVYKEKIKSTDYWKARDRGYKIPEKKEKVSLLESITPTVEAITLDTNTDSTCSACSSLSFSHTNNGGSGNILIVNTNFYNATGDGIDGLTYNGDSLTAIYSVGVGNIDVSSWKSFTTPATGANTILISFSGTQDFAISSVSSFSGVDSATLYNVSTNTKTGFGKNSNTRCESPYRKGWVVDAITKYNTTETITLGSEQTTLDNLSVGAGFGIIGGSSYIANTSNLKDFSWTWTTTDRDFASLCITLNPIESEEIRTNIKGSVNIQGKVNI